MGALYNGHSSNDRESNRALQNGRQAGLDTCMKVSTEMINCPNYLAPISNIFFTACYQSASMSPALALPQFLPPAGICGLGKVKTHRAPHPALSLRERVGVMEINFDHTHPYPGPQKNEGSWLP